MPRNLNSHRRHKALAAAEPGTTRLKATLLLGPALALALCLCGCSTAPVQDGPDAQEPGSTGNGQEQVVTNPGNYLFTAEDVASMSPEQLRELTTITVESVTGADGNIDWELYAQKLTEIRLAVSLAGTTPDEMIAAYRAHQNGDSQEMSEILNEKYSPLYEGFAAPEANLENERDINESMIDASFSAYGLDTGPIVRTLDLLDTDIQNASNSGATINMTLHTTDNFFSSGTYSENTGGANGGYGRDADMNLTYTEGVVTVVQNGKIYVSQMTNG